MPEPITYDARIKMKTDSEEKWALVENSFVPMTGEIIVYTPDSNHDFPRIKIGEEPATLKNLPFMDSVMEVSNYNSLPQPGVKNKLYIDISTNRIYRYTSNGYIQLSNFPINITTDIATRLRTSDWSQGIMTEASIIDNHILRIINGTTPSLTLHDVTVVTNVGYNGV